MKPFTNALNAVSRRTGPRVALGGVLAILLGAGAVLSTQRVAPSAALAGQNDFTGLVEIGGGRRLYLECRGSGSPTVVLLSGYSNHGGVWNRPAPDVPPPAVLPGVAAFTRVCTYDRPGTFGDPADPTDRSRSDPVPQPRAAEDTVADLHALLRAATIPGPYVLAAHSLGGLYARLYAAAYPDEVVGLVLIDAGHEQLQAELGRLLTPAQFADLERAYLEIREIYPDFELMEERTYALVRRARVETPLRPMPLAVLSRDRAEPEVLPGWPVEEYERSWRAMQDDLATLVPNARHTIAHQIGHGIHQEQPALVIEAIRQVVTGVRHPDTWDDLVSCCAP